MMTETTTAAPAVPEATPTPDQLDDDDFRGRLRSFLAEHHPGDPPRDRRERLAFDRSWAALMADSGYAGPAWPTEWGGMDLALSQQLIYHDEVARARVPVHPSPHAFMVGPTILAAGTEDQCRRFLRPTLRADILWAQGFSEPDAGSDLAALRTRAERDGDDYVVNGIKVWASRADYSDWLFTLVRTGTPESRQHGISYLLIDLASPGLAVLPLRDMTGGHRFTQITFTDVRVPVQNRVGAEDRGWPIARTTLGHERSTSRVPAVLRYRRVVAELIELSRERGLNSDPLIRQRLARVHTGCEVLITTSRRIVADLLRGGEPGPASSMFRLSHALFEQELHETAMAILGTAGLLGSSEASSVQGGRWVWGYLNTRASTIGAGTAEIQRNTMAERVLGLPRELAPS
jgi:alkylation response protein AidB-like acyl-CoA dehydrogenase